MWIYLLQRKAGVQTIKYVILITIIFAMVLDLRDNRISNHYLLVVWGIGIGLKVAQKGIQGLLVGIILTLLPLVLLYFLHQMKALGGGDIKLFGAIATFLNIETLIQWMAFSFLAGGAMAIWILMKKKIFRQRILYLCQYMKDQSQLFPNHRIYQNAHIGQENVIHFTISMVVGYCILLMKG